MNFDERVLTVIALYFSFFLSAAVLYSGQKRSPRQNSRMNLGLSKEPNGPTLSSFGSRDISNVDIWRVLDEVISAITSSMTKLDLLTVQRRDKGFRRQLFTTLICSTCITQHSSTSFLWIHIEIESAGIPSSQL